MSHSVNSKLLEQMYVAFNNRQFNPKLVGAHLALDGNREQLSIVLEMLVGFLQANSQDYLYNTSHIYGTEGISKLSYEMLQVYESYLSKSQ
jgi:hypothetical protein